MPRITITPPSPFRLRYRDSLHAALIAGLRAADAPEDLILGPDGGADDVRGFGPFVPGWGQPAPGADPVDPRSAPW